MSGSIYRMRAHARVANWLATRHTRCDRTVDTSKQMKLGSESMLRA